MGPQNAHQTWEHQHQIAFKSSRTKQTDVLSSFHECTWKEKQYLYTVNAHEEYEKITVMIGC